MDEMDNAPQSNARDDKREPGHKMSDAERAQVQENFLEVYAKTGNVLVSCKVAKIDRKTFYNWQEKDEEFGFRAHQAERDFADLVLAEFVQRAVHGYEKPVVSAGRIVYESVPELDQYGHQVVDEDGKPVIHHKPLMERVVSDSLLAMAVKKHFPEYREKQQVDVNNNSSGTMEALHEAIAKALEPFPDAKIALAAIMASTGNES